jgi:hypothetical protein
MDLTALEDLKISQVWRDQRQGDQLQEDQLQGDQLQEILILTIAHMNRLAPISATD